MLRALIIEDEPPSRELLAELIQQFFEAITIVGMAADVASGIECVQTLKPDLVFLDVEMPGGDGFEVLKALEHIPFKVIFVTGYDHYAIQAIRFSALDYLLKPVNLQELERAIDKALQQEVIDQQQLQNLEWYQQQVQPKAERLMVSTDREHVLIDLDQVLYLEAEGGYVQFVLEDNRRQWSTHALAHYEDLLPPERFYRTHYSYIVNCDKVSSVSTGRGGEILLSGGQSVPIAFRRKSAFIKFLEQRQ